MSDSEGRENDVNHVVEQLLGSYDAQQQRPPKQPQRKPRVHLRLVDSPVDWMPKPGLPAGGRDECRNGERPCPYVRCKWHLWLVLGEDRRGRRWDPTGTRGDNGRWLAGSSTNVVPPKTTLIPAWLEYPTPPCCALDIAEQGDIAIKRIAEALHCSRNNVHRIIARGIAKLKALRKQRRIEQLRELVEE